MVPLREHLPQTSAYQSFCSSLAHLQASDSLEQTRYTARQYDSSRTGLDAAADSANKAYYDAKKNIQNK